MCVSCINCLSTWLPATEHKTQTTTATLCIICQSETTILATVACHFGMSPAVTSFVISLEMQSIRQIMIQLVTCRCGASCRRRRSCHRTGMGKCSHLWPKIEFRSRRLCPQADVLLMRLPTAQHNINLQITKWE